MTLEVACGGDLDYLQHTAAMMSSVLEHAGGPVRFSYLHDPRLDPRDARALADWVDSRGGVLELLAIQPERLEGLPERRGHLTPAMWYRLFLPDLLPDVGRVLYLDADTIAVDALAPLWATDLEGGMVAAVTNVFDPWNAGYESRLGLAKPYFNSGVLVMDLEAMRAQEARRRVLDYARAHPEATPWGDQDPLNVVLGATRAELHPRWNCMNSFHLYPEDATAVFGRERYEEAVARPGIRHFEGPSVNKPWHLLCDRPGRDDYLRHRRATPWPKVRRQGITPANLARWLGRRVRA